MGRVLRLSVMVNERVGFSPVVLPGTDVQQLAAGRRDRWRPSRGDRGAVSPPIPASSFVVNKTIIAPADSCLVASRGLTRRVIVDVLGSSVGSELPKVRAAEGPGGAARFSPGKRNTFDLNQQFRAAHIGRSCK